MKRVISTIGICLLFLSSYGQELTLRECIDMGLKNNLSIQRGNISIDIATNSLSENRSKLLPVLNADIQFADFLMKPTNVTTGALLGNDFPDNPTWQQIRSMQYSVGAGIQLTMPLFNKTIYSGIEVAKTMVEISRLSTQQAEQQLTVAIANTYYTAQAFNEQAKLLDANIKRMSELSDITRAMFEGGVALEIDLNRVKINISNIEVLRKQYATAYETQLNLLRFLLDISPDQKISVCSMKSLSFSPDNVSEVSDNLPELNIIRQRKDLVARQISMTKAGYLPTIALFGQLGVNGYQDSFKGFFNDNSHHWFGNTYLGIKVNIPIFDANSKRKKIKGHSLELTQMDIALDEQRKSLERDFSDTYRKLDLNISSFNTQKSNYNLALSVYNVTEERYKEGVASMTDLLQDEMRMRESQIACIHALCECHIANIQLLKLTDNLHQLK
ncbi:TolC family protein [Bacteroides caecimuris]|nr:TolC family protein [Bacteroides caecimuris]